MRKRIVIKKTRKPITLTAEYVTKLAREYNLIQEKKSDLTRSQRDAVERMVKKLIKEGVMEPIPDNTTTIS